MLLFSLFIINEQRVFEKRKIYSFASWLYWVRFDLISHLSALNSPVVYITLTGMFLSILLFFYNKGYRNANAFLAGFLFLSSLFIFIQYVFIYSHDLNVIIWFVAGFPSLFYLIGPFAYLYVRSILRDNTRLSRTDYLHFLLALLVLIGAIPYIFSGIEHKLMMARYIASNDLNSIRYRPNAIFPPMFNRTLRPLHLMGYSFLILATLYKYRDKLFKNKNHSAEFLITKRWLLAFCCFVPLMALFHIFIFYSTIIVKTKSMFIQQSYPLLFIFSLLYFMMLASLLFFPHVLYGMPVKPFLPSENLIHQSGETISDTEERVEVGTEDNTGDLQQPETAQDKYVQLFPEEYLQEVKDKLSAWIEQKHFLDPETNMSTLSVQVKIPQHHLSFYFNTILEVKFTDWRNMLKIDYATALIDQGYFKSLTLEALSSQCGFSSQSTFIRAFKNAKGLTPSEYIKARG